ncbi:MAG: hypothetical protein M3178_03975 [Pseudomonadota bacterium]|nr:hypothetical protein [Pseudomonadota bacterium]
MIRTIYPAADFLVPFVKALAVPRGRVLRERGIDAIKIAPKSGAGHDEFSQALQRIASLTEPIRAPSPWDRA